VSVWGAQRLAYKLTPVTVYRPQRAWFSIGPGNVLTQAQANRFLGIVTVCAIVDEVNVSVTSAKTEPSVNLLGIAYITTVLIPAASGNGGD
jgi:hypothetical protein